MGVTIFSTPWSPPAAWKSNGSVDYGGTLLSADYQNYATWLANYVKNMKADGITVYGVSMQNEPDWTASYDSCVWTASEFDTMLFSYLEPTFTADGLSSTKIILPEETHWDSLNLVSTVLSDSRLSSYSNIIFADHTYGDDSTNSPITGLDGDPIWETEHTGDNPDIGVQAALDLAEDIYHVVGQNQASAYNYWWINDAGGGGLLGGNWQSTYNFAAMENFSRFIRPGWVQIGESDDNDGLQICDFQKSVDRQLRRGADQRDLIGHHGNGRSQWGLLARDYSLGASRHAQRGAATVHSRDRKRRQLRVRGPCRQHRDAHRNRGNDGRDSVAGRAAGHGRDDQHDRALLDEQPWHIGHVHGAAIRQRRQLDYDRQRSLVEHVRIYRHGPDGEHAGTTIKSWPATAPRRTPSR